MSLIELLNQAINVGLTLWLFALICGGPCILLILILYNSCRTTPVSEVCEARRKSANHSMQNLIKPTFVNILNRVGNPNFVPEGDPIYKRESIIEDMLLTAAVIGDADGFKTLWNFYKPKIEVKKFFERLLKTEKSTLFRHLFQTGMFSIEELSKFQFSTRLTPKELEDQGAIGGFLLQLSNYENLFDIISECIKLDKYQYIQHLLVLNIVSHEEIVQHLGDSALTGGYTSLRARYHGAPMQTQQTASACSHP